MGRVASRPPAPSAVSIPTSASILLQDGVVIDSTEDTALLLPSAPHPGSGWGELRELVLPVFPGFPRVPPESGVSLEAAGNSDMTMRIATDGGFVRCVIRAPQLAERRSRMRLSDQLAGDRNRAALDSTPQPIWQTDHDNQVIWYNSAFAQLCRESGTDPHGESPFADIGQAEAAAGTVRARVALTDGRARWFALTTRQTDAGPMHFATAIDTLVEAERAQRTFVQTLTKTFAHLPIGLAVFDRDHRLVLFNPALVDLTRLPVDFLSARPNLLSFFDHMRENRMMPEPKSYSGWREQLAQVICAARDDRYCETWNLPSGLTYKITGRPHPDRAVAFLLEDISAEISLTRRFRSELELTQSVIDCFDEAVAVFSQLGVLTFCNSAYREMWKCDPDSAFAEVTIMDATQDWQRACLPSPIWDDLRDFVLTMRERSAWTAPLTMFDGRGLTCAIEPVAAGATMVRFARERRVAVQPALA
ncbi:PAS-domain containing protein [Citreimonas salinaria]|uniref:PAS domain-containing protein n=1 Tax=Citreimonas salinaria TaxID=321339 RepID=A0A1H3FCF6_9RHOB|nr:PAS-domain containing protein [Citreimonas salinaria]SDX87809.1 PAS domain-containing protein [Citreimonas salinaria]